MCWTDTFWINPQYHVAVVDFDDDDDDNTGTLIVGLMMTGRRREGLQHGSAPICYSIYEVIHRIRLSTLLPLKTRNVLDCDQSNYSSRIIFSCKLFLQRCSVIHESGSDNSFQRYGHSKFSKMAGGRILDLVQSEVGPFDSPSQKPYRRTKHEVDRMTRCRDMAIRSFPKCEVGRWSVLNITLFSCIALRYVRNVAREE